MTRFLGKHQKLFSFIGASIVFATFIVRDVVREHFKDLADSLEQAENFYAVRGQLDTTNQRLKSVMHHQDSALFDTLPKNTPAFIRLKAGIDRSVEANISDVQDLEATQDNLNRLLHKFPSAPYEQVLGAYREQLAQLKTERDQMETTMSGCDNSKVPDDHCSWDFMYDMDHKSDDLDNKLFWMRVELSKRYASILDDAEQALDRRDRSYRYASIISIALFTVGWILGLLGTIYEIKGLTVEDK